MRHSAILAILLLVGCAGRLGYTATYSGTYSSEYAYAPYAPPEPLVEVITPAPGPGYAWINGYWEWNGNDYVWAEGHWAPRPQAGYVWLHHGWTFENGRYYLRPGRWVERGYRPPYAYVNPPPRVQFGARYSVLPRPGVVHRGNVWITPPTPRGPRYVQPRRPGYVYVEPPRVATPRVYPPRVAVVPPRPQVVVPRPPAPHVVVPRTLPGSARVVPPGRPRVYAPAPPGRARGIEGRVVIRGGGRARGHN